MVRVWMCFPQPEFMLSASSRLQTCKEMFRLFRETLEGCWLTREYERASQQYNCCQERLDLAKVNVFIFMVVCLLASLPIERERERERLSKKRRLRGWVLKIVLTIFWQYLTKRSSKWPFLLLPIITWDSKSQRVCSEICPFRVFGDRNKTDSHVSRFWAWPTDSSISFAFVYKEFCVPCPVHHKGLHV